MTFSTYAANGPRNLYAAQRAGVDFHDKTRDAHAKRRIAQALVAAVIVTVNLGAVGALFPAAKTALGTVSLTALSAPQN